MGRVVHFEIEADDPARAIVFYKNVFGWKIEEWQGPGDKYWLVMTGKDGSKLQGKEGDGIDGAILKRRGVVPAHNNPVSAFVCTIEVENLDEACKNVVEHGGNMVVDKAPIATVGWLCYCKDTEGNVFGMMQPDEQAK